MLIHKIQPICHLLHAHSRIQKKAAGRVDLPCQHIVIGALSICIPKHAGELGGGKAGEPCQIRHRYSLINVRVDVLPDLQSRL